MSTTAMCTPDSVRMMSPDWILVDLPDAVAWPNLETQGVTREQAEIRRCGTVLDGQGNHSTEIESAC